MKIEITDLTYYKRVKARKNDWPCLSAIINGEQHCSGDVRFFDYREEPFVVFSSSTTDDKPPALYQSIQDNVKAEILAPVPVEIVNTKYSIENGYIYVYFKHPEPEFHNLLKS